MNIKDNLAWSCDMAGFEHVWGSWSFLISLDVLMQNKGFPDALA